jgi:chemotaxis protein methyltransferase CheR
MMTGIPPATEELEIELLLEALYQRHGFDFRAYERHGLACKLRAAVAAQGARTVSGLQERVLHEASAGRALLRALSVQPGPLFDDPEQARQLRIVLASCLRASAVPKVWLAECAGAEEAWAVAILLAEEHLHQRTEIFATMANEEMLAEAERATISLEHMAAYQESYLKSGGTGNLADYFEIHGRNAVLLPQLRSRITWAQYSLVTDASFNEFQLILCQRALPEFGPVLRQRVLRLFDESMALFGILGIAGELDEGDSVAANYQSVFPRGGWYKRVAGKQIA